MVVETCSGTSAYENFDLIRVELNSRRKAAHLLFVCCCSRRNTYDAAGVAPVYKIVENTFPARDSGALRAGLIMQCVLHCSSFITCTEKRLSQRHFRT